MELKPCPFCGNRDIGIYSRIETDYVLRNGDKKVSTISDRWHVICRNCSCGTYYGFCEEEVVEAWNRRAENE